MDAGPVVVVLPGPIEAAQACGARTFELLEAARHERGTATLAVSGGSTPRIMFQWMAAQPFDWSGIRLFQVDERCFPPDHEQSNYRMLRQALLDPAGIRPEQVVRVHGELSPEEAARLYESEVQTLPDQVFDVIQRGMGSDAHTASLFPGEPRINDQTGLVAALWVEKMQQHRVTLLRGVLEKARTTLCLVTGSDKAKPLHRVLQEPFDPQLYPAQIGREGAVWFVDPAAVNAVAVSQDGA